MQSVTVGEGVMAQDGEVLVTLAPASQESEGPAMGPGRKSSGLTETHFLLLEVPYIFQNATNRGPSEPMRWGKSQLKPH